MKNKISKEDIDEMVGIIDDKAVMMPSGLIVLEVKRFGEVATSILTTLKKKEIVLAEGKVWIDKPAPDECVMYDEGLYIDNDDKTKSAYVGDCMNEEDGLPNRLEKYVGKKIRIKAEVIEE